MAPLARVSGRPETGPMVRDVKPASELRDRVPWLSAAQRARPPLARRFTPTTELAGWARTFGRGRLEIVRAWAIYTTALVAIVEGLWKYPALLLTF